MDVIWDLAVAGGRIPAHYKDSTSSSRTSSLLLVLLVLLVLLLMLLLLLQLLLLLLLLIILRLLLLLLPLLLQPRRLTRDPAGLADPCDRGGAFKLMEPTPLAGPGSRRRAVRVACQCERSAEGRLAERGSVAAAEVTPLKVIV